MLLVTVCFLITTSVFADDYGNHSGPKPFPVMLHFNRATKPPEHHTDNNDDNHSRDSRIKPTKSSNIYNYEDTRRHRVPQVDLREENVGKYMYGHPETTTPQANHNVPINDAGNTRIHPDPYYYENDSASAFNYEQHWNQRSEQPTTMPPTPTPPRAPAPKWHDISETYNTPAYPNSKSSNEQKFNQAPDYSMDMRYSSDSQLQQQPPTQTPPRSPAPKWHDISESYNSPAYPYFKTSNEQKFNEAPDYSLDMRYSSNTQPHQQPPTPTLPRSPAPKWHDISESYNTPAYPYSKSNQFNEALDYSMDMRYGSNSQPQQQWYNLEPKWVASPNTVLPDTRPSFKHYHEPPYSSELYEHPAPPPSSTVPPVNYESNYRYANEYAVQPPFSYTKPETNRESFRYNWNDVVLNERHEIATTTPTNFYQYQKVVPPVPTLTPWFDGYRK